MKSFAALLLLSLFAVAPLAAEPRAFLEKHCFECHDGETKKGGLDLTTLRYDAAKPEKWIQVHDAVADGEMPPAKKKSQPTPAERAAFVAEGDVEVAVWSEVKVTTIVIVGFIQLLKEDKFGPAVGEGWISLLCGETGNPFVNGAADLYRIENIEIAVLRVVRMKDDAEQSLLAGGAERLIAGFQQGREIEKR